MYPQPVYHYDRVRIDSATDIDGCGVFANKDMAIGEVLLRMVAPKIVRRTKKELHFLLPDGSIYEAPSHDAMIYTTRRGIIVDLANRRSGFATWWYMNHAGTNVACLPGGSVYMQANAKPWVRKSINGTVCVEWCAIREIFRNEEIVFDYGCPDDAWVDRIKAT